jgi:ParB-like nuclease domain
VQNRHKKRDNRRFNAQHQNFVSCKQAEGACNRGLPDNSIALAWCPCGCSRRLVPGVPTLRSVISALPLMNKPTSAASSRLALTYRPVGDLIPDPRNARTHSKRQIEQIRASIEAFGFTNPILADPEGRIIARRVHSRQYTGGYNDQPWCEFEFRGMQIRAKRCSPE